MVTCFGFGSNWSRIFDSSIFNRYFPCSFINRHTVIWCVIQCPSILSFCCCYFSWRIIRIIISEIKWIYILFINWCYCNIPIFLRCYSWCCWFYSEFNISRNISTSMDFLDIISCRICCSNWFTVCWYICCWIECSCFYSIFTRICIR